MHSALYEGRLRHRRFTPVDNRFSYPIFMLYLDLDELDQVFAQGPGWSNRRAALARYRREDYLGDPQVPLIDAVREVVFEQLNFVPTGPVRMLTHVRYCGLIFNPVTFYYCFGQDGETLEAIVAEVNNTPWNERHRYAMDCREQGSKQQHRINKGFHVSPFNPMDMHYRWRSVTPGRRLLVHMEIFRENTCHMDATLTLHRRPLRPRTQWGVLWRYPMMTMQVVWSIYWQAVKLWIKGAPLYPHPGKAHNNGG